MKICIAHFWRTVGFDQSIDSGKKFNFAIAYKFCTWQMFMQVNGFQRYFW